VGLRILLQCQPKLTKVILALRPGRRTPDALDR